MSPWWLMAWPPASLLVALAFGRMTGPRDPNDDPQMEASNLRVLRKLAADAYAAQSPCRSGVMERDLDVSSPNSPAEGSQPSAGAFCNGESAAGTAFRSINPVRLFARIRRALFQSHFSHAPTQRRGI